MSAERIPAALLLVGLLLLALVGPASALDVSGLTHLDGSEVASSELPDDAILVVFATWSPRCRRIAADTDDIYKRWNRIAPVFLVNFQEDPSVLEKFINDKSPKAKVLLDRRAVFSKAHSITSLPGLLAIKDGMTAFRGKLTADVDSVLRPIFE